MRDNIAHISDWDNGFIILDVSDPENPIELAHFDDGGTSVALYVEGNLAYISEWYDGLEILNISNPEYPEKIVHYDQSKETKMVHVDENLIYVADGFNGLVIIETNMTQSLPSELVSIETQEPGEEESTPISEPTGGGIPGFPFESIALGAILGILFSQLFQRNKLS